MEKIIREIKLARGVLIHDNKVLLVQDLRPGQGHFFLPGGNVEPGESISSALPREWDEELGWKVQTKTFIGYLEHIWTYNRKADGALVDVFEVNFLFSVAATSDQLSQNPVSKESHLNFSWVPLNELSSINLLPAPLRKIIPTIGGDAFELEPILTTYLVFWDIKASCRTQWLFSIIDNFAGFLPEWGRSYRPDLESKLLI